MDRNCTNEEKIVITAKPTTTTGKPASLDGGLRASVISGDGTFNVIDELNIELISSDAPGDTTYLIEADADLGEGVTLIQDTEVLHVAGAQAAALGLTAGAPVPK